MIQGVHHTTIVTRDPQRLLEFYRDVIGFQETVDLEWDGIPDVDRMVQLDDSAGKMHLLWTGNMFLEICEYRRPVGRAADAWRPVNDVGINHVCLDVVNFHEEFDRLTAAGVHFNSPGLTAPPDPASPGFSVHTTYGRDPDGNSFEFQETIEKDSPMRIESDSQSNIRGLHHTSLVTQNPDEMVRFYTEVAGFDLIKTFSFEQGFAEVDEMLGIEDAAATLYMLRAGNTHVEITHFRNPLGKPAESRPPANDSGYRHFCLDVIDFDDEHARFQDAGVVFNAPPLTTPPGIVEPELTVKTAYARDPDGNLFEFQQVLDQSSRMSIMRGSTGAAA